MNDPHRVRRLVLQGLCTLDVQGPPGLEGVYAFIKDSDDDIEVRVSAAQLLRDAWDSRAEADRLLTRHAKRWELSRLALVDRNILRLGVCELLALKLSHKIIISEALRLAREFSTAESPRFVNGVLDAVAKEIAKETA